MLFFNEKVIFVKKPIIIIGGDFAMDPYHGTSLVHALLYIIDFYDSVYFSALLLLILNNI